MILQKAIVLAVLTVLAYHSEVFSQYVPLTTQQPVIWRAKNTPIVFGYDTYDLNVQLVNPCEIFSNKSVHPDLLNEARNKCNEIYEEYFLSELQEMCPDNTRMQSGRRGLENRRELICFSIIDITSLAAMAIGTLWMKISTLSSDSENLNYKLKQQENLLHEKANQLKLVDEAVNKMADDLKIFGNNLNDLNDLKSSMISTNYAVLYVTTKLLTSRPTIRESSRDFQKGKLNYRFFEMLNVSLPCGKMCPMEYGVAKTCLLKNGFLKMSFDLPQINNTMVLLEADSFELIHQTNNLTCFIKYTGPENAILTKSTDCVHSTNIKFHDLVLSPATSCDSEKGLPEKSTYFHLDVCHKKGSKDAQNKIQIKRYASQNYIYCRYNNITIGKMTKPCPEWPFIIPSKMSFSVNDRHYSANKLKIDHTSIDDPRFTVKANHYIHPHVNMTDILENISRLYPDSEFDTWYSWSHEHTWWTQFVATLSIATCIAAIIIFILVRRCLQNREEPMNMFKMGPLGEYEP